MSLKNDSGLARSADFERGVHPAETACRADDLKGLLQVLGDQIADADRRHSDALQEMQQRLARLGGQTGTLKAGLPPHLASAFERIEDGMTALAERLAEVDQERRPGPLAADAPVVQVAAPVETLLADPHTGAHAPLDDARDDDFDTAPSYRPAAGPGSLGYATAGGEADAPPPLRSAIGNHPPGTWGRTEAMRLADPHAGLDALHDAEPAGMDAASDEPWDHQSAAALARLYETGEPGLPPPAAPLPMLQVATPAPVAGEASAHHHHEDAGHRAWLEARLGDVATRVEQSLRDLKPETSLAAFGQRFDSFEERFSSALDGMATRTDVEGLRLIEAHVSELSSRLEETREHLARLDAIEAQLGEMRHHLSEEEILRVLGAAVPTEDDLVRYAEQAAGLAAERVLAERGPDASAHANAGGSNKVVEAVQAATSRQMGSMQEMLALFMDEHRRGEASTAEALETMQAALQHMLDRVDVIEMQGRGAAPHHAAPHHAAPHHGAQMAVDLDAGFAAPGSHAPAASPPSGRNFAEEARAAARLAQARMAQGPHGEERLEPHLDGPGGDIVSTQVHARQSRPDAEPAADEAPVDARSFIAMARRAAEEARLKSAAAEAAPAADMPPAKAAGIRERVLGGAGEGAPKTGMRQGLLLVASLAAFLVAGYLLVSSPKLRALGIGPSIGRGAAPAKPDAGPATPGAATPRPTTSGPAIDTTPAATPTKLPAVAPGAGTQPAAPVKPDLPGKPRSVPETVTDDLSALPKPAPGNPTAQAVPRMPVPEMPVVPARYGIAIEKGARHISVEEILRAREKARLATLSQRTAYEAARTSTVPRASVPAGVLAPVPGDEPGRTAQLELPPALVGPHSLRLAAAKGDPSAQLEVAARLAEAKGVKQDFAQAAVWYQRAAMQGLPLAQYRLATLYERGLGVPADPARARLWYQRAAEKGNLKSMHNLAVLAAGRDKDSADYVTAVRWFTEAAMQGLGDSQFNLGVLHESGIGVERDLATAYKWYALAARSGDREAIRRRDLARGKLEASVVKAADESLVDWRPRPSDVAANDARAAGEAWKKRAQN